MKVKTSEVFGAALGWAVAQCEGVNVRWSAPHEQLLIVGLPYSVWQPHKDWSQGGPILDREQISMEIHENGYTLANLYRMRLAFDGRTKHYHHHHGPTPLTAVMRCYVELKLGSEVDVPDELMEGSN